MPKQHCCFLHCRQQYIQKQTWKTNRSYLSERKDALPASLQQMLLKVWVWGTRDASSGLVAGLGADVPCVHQLPKFAQTSVNQKPQKHNRALLTSLPRARLRTSAYDSTSAPALERAFLLPPSHTKRKFYLSFTVGH